MNLSCIQSRTTAAAPGDLPGYPVNADEITAALAEILASNAFCRAQRTCRLLHYLVGRRLAGATRDTGEYSIGIAVFDRDSASYDTGDDPIVRVQVGRLRERLRAYYAGAGCQSAIRFSIPLGSYLPDIRRATPARAVRQHLLALQTMHSVGAADGAAFAAGLDEELAYRLFQEFGQNIVAHTFPPDCGINRAAVSHRLEGCIRVEGAQLRASLRVIDASAGSIAWSQQFDRSGGLGIAAQEELARAICAGLARYFALG